MDWRISIGSASVLALAVLLLILRLPERPRWLVTQDRGDEARQVLERVRHSGADIDAEMAEMRELARAEAGAKTRGWLGLEAPWLRPAVIIGGGVAIFTQLSGIEMIIYHSPTILDALIITCLIVFMAFNAGGLQLLGWLTGSEVHPWPCARRARR